MDSSKRPLPEGWRWVRLGDVIAEAKPGFATGARDAGGVVQLRMNNVDTRGRTVWREFIRVPAQGPVVNEYELTAGDVLFNNTNSVELVGKSALFLGFQEPVVYSNHFTRLRTAPGQLDPQYLASWLLQQWQMKVFENICNRWIGQSAVKGSKLLDLEIPLPPLAEQKRIAKILNKQMAAVERARAAAQTQFEAAKALPAAYLRAVFESPEAQRWPRRPIREMAQTCSGTTPSRSRKDYYSGAVPWIKTGELVDDVITASEESVTDIALQETSLRLLPPGTLLIAMYGQGQTRGRTGVLSIPATTNQACLAILPNGAAFDPQYLQLWFRSNYGRIRQETEGRGGNQPNLNGDLIRDLEVQLPPLEEQQSIVCSLARQLADAEGTQRAVEAQLDAINKLPAALLRRAFSGEL
jgi:type I restriction enzyme S subunit